MIIHDSELPFEPLWEGALEPGAGMFKAARGDEAPTIRIGKPHWWNQQNIMGDKLITPASGARYGLARFVFALRPQKNQEVKRVEFNIHLHAKGAGARPIAFDLLPKTTTVEQTGKASVGIDPKFKFVAIEASGIPKAEVSIEIKQAKVVIESEGTGSSAARWLFESHAARPLVGDTSVYVIVELPPHVEAARAALHLRAEVKDRFNVASYFVPEEQRERLSVVLG
jgi:hypothetical protein